MTLIKNGILPFLLSLLIPPALHAQRTTITGKITDNKGRPILSASVHVKNSQTGTSTDTLGTFSLRTQAADSLVISAVGFGDTTLLAGNHTTLTIVLLVRTTPLHEAVVTGATPGADNPSPLEAAREQVVSAAFQDYIRSAQFSNGQIQGSYIAPGPRGAMHMVNVSTNGFGPLNTLNQGTMLPVLTHQEDTRGSRYLLKNFAHGVIVDNTGKLITDSLNLLNYDKIDGQLMIARDANNYLEVDKEKVVAFAFRTPDTFFIFLNVPILSKINYFQLIASGTRYSVYKSLRTKFVKANYVSNGLTESGSNYDEYVDTETYFWVAGKDSAGVFELKKRSIKSVFAGERPRVEDYLSKHKLDDIDDRFVRGLIDRLNDPR